jgi:ABC-type transport system substrate-binding protein
VVAGDAEGLAQPGGPRAQVTVAPGGGPPLPKERVDELAVRYPSRLHISPELSTIYFFLSSRVPPFDDVRARRAVRLAWDREAVARVLGRSGSPTCRILPRNFPGYRPTCPGPGGVAALDRARRLVRRSGTQGTRVTVWLISGAPRGLGDYVVSLLDSLGYRARLRVVPGSVYFNKVADPKTRAQIGFGGWALDYPSAEGFIRPLLSCGAYRPASPETTTNIAAFCDRAIDRQMTRAAEAEVHDPAAGIALWQRVEDAILARAPIVPAFNKSYISLVSARVGNYEYNPQWGILLDQLWER